VAQSQEAVDPRRGRRIVSSQAHPPRTGREQADRKAQVLTHGAASVVPSIADAIVIKQGEPFFLCPPDGQIDTSGHHGFGLYHHDARFLSGCELRIAGVRFDSLAATAPTGAEALLELTNPPLELEDGQSFPKQWISLRWTRHLDGDPPRLIDRLVLHNYSAHEARMPATVSFAADFQDIFAIRGLLVERAGQLRDPHWDGERLRFQYDGEDGITRRLTVSFDRPLDAHEGSSARLSLDVPAHDETGFEIRYLVDEETRPGARPIERRTRRDTRSPEARARKGQGEGPAHAPGGGPGWSTSVVTDSISLDAALGRSLTDLLTLRDELDGQRYYAAGIPWFSTLFGRDSLIAAYQTLAFEPSVAAETLRLLASRQGANHDAWRDEEPGKILHELRVGELARLHEIPHTPYYGSVDSTPLFLVLLARHAAWTGRLDLFRELRSNVDRALGWIDANIAASGTGYVTYHSTTRRGLVNQGWKDSGDGIVDADGSVAEPPIALVEVQAYVYAAKTGIADLYERAGDNDRAAALRGEADDLRQRFEREFWSDSLGCYALAIADGGRRCDVVTSNAGQVLWTGIASPGHAAAVTERLLRDDMFDGWGIRTLSSRAKAYNPVGYHLGTVWPHDNGLIAEGFWGTGRDDVTGRLLSSLVDAAQDFPQERLPECFSGYAKRDFGVPVRYPIACHPQAWAAGAIPHVVTSSLGLLPEAFEGRLRIVRPRLPGFVRHVELRGMRVGGTELDLAFDSDGHATRVSVERLDGDLDVAVEPRDGEASPAQEQTK
jgi:glycogen debranching enzyme